ncbi:hypothetical protein SAMN02745148_01255 [Modicisalibacter ilicicola DSM 19980]|uniref:Preprotein translocase subunit YajC n=1 Tax=Modicisalibacter ilicicola DSM 19980 TaxID=1121942 RepID=A0A1M4WY79_9GAMM|nr:preprotein translocase subunit YajC [Halomonas ilicicola]SHE86241.1 hypothetical protein SAMN02745148_01255 [Halomonas ilicicola DSM 19980]
MAFWLVTLFAMLAILSPVMWLRPSRRDRRLGELRQYARQKGVGVKFAKPPLHAPTSGVLSYSWPYPQHSPGPYFVLVRNSHAGESLRPFSEEFGEWRWRIEPLRPLLEEARRSLESALEQLPEDALVLESERGYLTLWWSESQDVTAFDATHAVLATARDALGDPGQGRDSLSAPP